MRVMLVGVSCVGTSTVGKLLAEKWKYQFIDFDFEIEERMDERITSLKNRLFNEYEFRQTVKHILGEVLDEYSSNLVIAMPPGGMSREYMSYFKRHTDVITVALKDRAKAIMKRLTFYDDESNLMTNYQVTEKTYDYYYNEVKEDISYFHPQYKKADIQLHIYGMNATEATEALAENLLTFCKEKQ